MIVTWMLRMLVASVLVALGAWLVERVLSALGRPVRFAWMGGLVAVAVAPFVAVWLNTLSWRGGTALHRVEVDAALTRARDAAYGATVGNVGVVGEALPILWVGAALVGLAVYGAGWWRLWSARRCWRRGRVAGRSVLVSPAAGPAAVGVLQPAIVVPEWVLAADEAVQRLVVLHEAEHLEAGDHVVLAVSPLVLVAMPWNVALLWMLRRLRLAVELDCDARVLARGVEPSEYGSLLLDVAGRRGVGALSIAMASPKSALERRLDAMTGSLPGGGRADVPVSIAAAILCVAVGCGMAPLAPLPVGDSEGHRASRPEPAGLVERFGGPGTRWTIDGRPATAADVLGLPSGGIAAVRVEETASTRPDVSEGHLETRAAVHVSTPGHLAASALPPGLYGSPRLDRIAELLDDPHVRFVIDGRESDRQAFEALAGRDIAKLEVVRRRVGDAVASGIRVETVATRSN